MKYKIINNQGLFLFLLLLLPVIGFAQKKSVKKIVPKPIVSTVPTDSLDKDTGLKNDDNLMYVRGHCTGCHSSKLILQHRFTRDEWQAKIKWMQQYHKLWDLGKAEKNVLDYLEKYYSAPVQKSLSLRRQQALKAFVWYKLDK